MADGLFPDGVWKRKRIHESCKVTDALCRSVSGWKKEAASLIVCSCTVLAESCLSTPEPSAQPLEVANFISTDFASPARPLLSQVIAQGAIASPMFAMKGPSMVAGKFAPAFPLKHQQKVSYFTRQSELRALVPDSAFLCCLFLLSSGKERKNMLSSVVAHLVFVTLIARYYCIVQDMRLALALGDKLNQPLSVAAAANEVYKAAKTQGLGDNDFSAVVEAVKKPGTQ